MLLSSCGGGGGNAGASDQAYVDALVTNQMAQKDKPAKLTTATARCVESAVVAQYHASAFAKAKLTPEKLRNPDTDLSALPDPTSAQAKGIGSAAQKCHVGPVVAADFRSEFGTDAKGADCMAQRIDDDAGLRPFLGAEFVGGSKIATADARQFVDAIAACVDLGTVYLKESDLTLTSAETKCLNTQLEQSDAFLDVMAKSLAGNSVSASESQSAVVPSMEKCLTTQRLQQLLGSG